MKILHDYQEFSLPHLLRYARQNHESPDVDGDTGPRHLHLPNQLHEGRQHVDDAALRLRLPLRGDAAGRGAPLHRLHNDPLDVEKEDRSRQLGDPVSDRDG